jgi:hypothetical protein
MVGAQSHRPPAPHHADWVRSGAPLGCVPRIRAVSRHPTVPSRIPLAPARMLLTGNRHSYPPCVGAGLANRLTLALAAGRRRHVTPRAFDRVAPLMSEQAMSRAHYSRAFVRSCAWGQTCGRA